MDYFIPYPESFVFENNQGVLEPFSSEHTQTYLFDRVDYSNGILVYKIGLNGVPLIYPVKGFQFPEAVSAIGIAKSAFIDTIKLISWELIPVFFLFVPFKRKIKIINRILSVYNRISFKAISPYILKDRYFTPFSREIQKMTYNFLYPLGVQSLDFSIVLSTCFEYDDAYRYRIEDVLSETSAEKLISNPRKELKRLFSILVSRQIKYDSIKTSKSFKYLGILLNIAFLSRKIRNSFISAIKQSTFSNLQYDEIDTYHVLAWDSYDFLGRSYQERYKIFRTLHNGNPPTGVDISNHTS